MLPNQLVAESFAGYPAEARRVAVSQVALLRGLPLAFVPLLLRELIGYDWKFPAERRELDRQFAYLRSLSSTQLAKAMAGFSQLRLSAELEKSDWVNSPATFTEQLTAHLWTSHQIDGFRAAAVDHMAKVNSAAGEEAPAPHRLGIAIIGQGVENNRYRLFRKLRAHGTYYTRVNPANGMKALVELMARRNAANPRPYDHWYIDGGPAVPGVPEGVASVSYAGLAPARAILQSRMQKIYEASVFDPEAFRSRMAQMQPAEIGLTTGRDAILNRFQLSLLTEGSGTQVFATTFVQWAAREAWRRAQPLTLMARFVPRQREKPMNELLAEARRRPELDPQGSLIDADMGAYYTWLNQQRLPGAEKAAFFAWFEDQHEAIAIGPQFGKGNSSGESIEIGEIAAQLA
jgi:hypothetical protein